MSASASEGYVVRADLVWLKKQMKFKQFWSEIIMRGLLFWNKLEGSKSELHTPPIPRRWGSFLSRVFCFARLLARIYSLLAPRCFLPLRSSLFQDDALLLPHVAKCYTILPLQRGLVWDVLLERLCHLTVKKMACFFHRCMLSLLQTAQARLLLKERNMA